MATVFYLHLKSQKVILVLCRSAMYQWLYRWIFAQKELVLILRSNVSRNDVLNVGDLVKVYVKLPNQKCGNWLPPRPVIGYDNETGIVTVPGKSGSVPRPAAEDVRFAPQSNLATEIQRAIDIIDLEIDDEAESVSLKLAEEDAEDDDDYDFTDTFQPTTGHCPPRKDAICVGTPQSEHSSDECNQDPEIPEQDSAEPSVGPWQVSYWNKNHHSPLPTDNSNNVNANSVGALTTITPGPKLSSIEQDVLKLYQSRFGDRSFSRKDAEGLPTWPLDKAYEAERAMFLKNVDQVDVAHVKLRSKSANIIGSHVIYKVKLLMMEPFE